MKNYIVSFAARTLFLSALGVPLAASAITLSVSPSGSEYIMNDGQSLSWTATASNCGNDSISYSMTKSPTHGTLTLDANFASNGRWTFTNDPGTKGDLSSVKETMTVVATCGTNSTSLSISVASSSSTCASDPAGSVIFDNTATPSNASIKSNLSFLSGCAKGSTTISNGFGGNAINTNYFQTVNRDTSTSPHKMIVNVGPEEQQVEDRLLNTDNQLNYFASGQHLFELNRLRSTADWLSQLSNGTPVNITPDAGVAVGTYGSITLKQFIQGIAEGKTFYGVVRVKIGLKRGQRSNCNSNCNINALRETVDASTIYGFCDANTNAGLCATTTACAPGKDFTRINPSTTVCGYALPSNAKIKVKGALFFDFLDHADGSIIPLANLPFAPRELYFMVNLPIMVNWINDANDDGAMDSMPTIRNVTAAIRATQEVPSNNSTIAGLSVDNISQESKDAYLFQTGRTLTSTEFNSLSVPDKYHLLMPSGYIPGWVEAFDKLNISGATWRTLPPDSCRDTAGSPCSKFGIGDNVSGIPSASDLRSAKFEDIPVYLYSGGLIDMHSHTNISGLVYVPQAMELEALNNRLAGQSISTHQYINGAIVVRDGFYIMANGSQTSITVIAADPTSYSTAKTIARTRESGFVAESGGPGTAPDGGANGAGGGGDGGLNLSDTSPCVGCIGAGQNSGANNASGAPGKRIWMEVHPQ